MRFRRCLVPIAAALLAGCSVPALAPPALPATSALDLPRAPPASQGIDPARLAAVLEDIRRSGSALDSLHVVRNGYLVLEVYRHPFEPGWRHDLASVTKSVTAIVAAQVEAQAGTAAIEGATRAVFAGRDAAPTLRQLLTMSSGLDCGRPGEPELRALQASPNWVEFAARLPPVAAPGTRFAYCSPATHLASAIAGRAAGEPLAQFAQRALFAPLGIDDVVWPADPQGVTRGWGDLQLRPLDLVRIGQLMLARGRRGERELIPARWVDEATRPQAKAGGGDDYGIGWWLPRGYPGVYQAEGRGGQRLIVWPRAALVVAMTGSGFDSGALAQALGRTLGDTPLAEDAAAQARLQRAIAALAAAPAAHPVGAVPPAARRLAGKRLVVGANPAGLRSLVLTPNGATARLEFEVGGESFAALLGMDGVPRSARLADGSAVAAHGRWRDVGTEVGLAPGLDAELRLYGRAVRLGVSATFAGDRVRLRVVEHTGLFRFDADARVAD